MNRQAFDRRIRQVEMGDWRIVTNEYTDEPRTLGYYYDERENSFKVYQNNDRSEANIQSFKTEEAALEELYCAAEVQQTLAFYCRDIHEIEDAIRPVETNVNYPSA